MISGMKNDFMEPTKSMLIESYSRNDFLKKLECSTCTLGSCTKGKERYLHSSVHVNRSCPIERFSSFPDDVCSIFQMRKANISLLPYFEKEGKPC